MELNKWKNYSQPPRLFGLLLYGSGQGFLRAIPNLEQVGVLKNFQLTTKEEIQGRFTVFNEKDTTVQSPLVTSSSTNRAVGGFQDLAYVSNITTYY